MLESKEALDAALANQLPAMAAACDARVKRQAAAVSATQAAILEIESKVKDIEAKQLDLVNAANKETESAPPRKGVGR